MPTGSGASDGTQQDASQTPYIKEVVLQNFMCHENFKLSLGPSMNVIVGNNGTGKSSILTGIMIALGGRAKTTSRGEALGSLVQTGKPRATVSLTINIPSEYRQMYQKYGNEVKVTRQITSGKGASLYKVRDYLGREVKGSNVQEVRLLCQHFGLYPDNELAMLSQENAKEFLVSASPQVKYDKLRKALLQNAIEHDRELVNSHNKEQEGLIQRIEILDRSATEKEAKANEILGRARAQASASAKFMVIKRILAWREVEEATALVDEAARELEKIDSKIADLERQLDVTARHQENSDEHQTLVSQRDQLSDNISDLTEKFEEAKRSVNSAKADHERTLKEVEELEEQARVYETQIDESERAAAELTPEAVARRSEEIIRQMKEADLRRAEASANISNEDAVISDLKESLPEYQDRLKLEKNNFAEERSRLSEIQAELKDLERGNSAKPHIPSSIRDLQTLVDKSRWDRKPIGPIYQFVRMKNNGADFAPALERLWTHTLEGWWVETESDRRQLMKLAQRCGISNLEIFKRRDDSFDFSSALPALSQDYVRVTDVIETDMEAIRRIFVDLNHIEGMVLVQNLRTAFTVTDNQRSRNKVKMAVAMTTARQGNRKFISVSSTFGRIESSTIDPMPQARMKVSAQARTRQVESELQISESELRSAKQRLEKANQSLKNVEQQIEEHQQAQRKAEALRRRADDDHSALYEQLMTLETQAKSSDIGDELNSIRKRLGSLEEQIEDGHEALQERREDLTEKTNILEDFELQLRSAKQELSELDSKIRANIRRSTEISNSQRQNSLRLDRLQTTQEQMAARIRSLNVNLDEKVDHAEQQGPNPFDADAQSVDIELSSNSNQSLLTETKAALESKLNTLRGQQEAVVTAESEIREAELMKSQAQQERKDVERSKSDMLRLVEEIRMRQRNRDDNEARLWEAIKQEIRAMFERTLSRRSFVGDVNIDDRGKKLIAHATPGQASDRSTSTLSGGEKSFTQVALLMAVWSTMHVGFVAMDEYDVFMDKVNRSLSLQLLAQVVKKKNLQCVLITPQDIDKRMLRSMNCKIHKLQAARPTS